MIEKIGIPETTGGIAVINMFVRDIFISTQIVNKGAYEDRTICKYLAFVSKRRKKGVHQKSVELIIL